MRDLGIYHTHIHYEFFGAGEVDESGEIGSAVEWPRRATVIFSRSESKAAWAAQCGTLLETTKAAGLTAPYNCRSGK